MLEAEGAVEGWRFGLVDGTGGRQPRIKATFDQLCASTAKADGKKRVGVVVDFGRDVDGDGKTAAPAPVATCVSVPTAATGTQVLAAATTTRVDKTMVCGINGYPATGCGGDGRNDLGRRTEPQGEPAVELVAGRAQGRREV